jgi:plasmid stability protein
MPMTAPAVTITLPEPLYNRLKQRAAHAQRSIEAEILEAVVRHVSAMDKLPTDLADEMAQLTFLDDEQLWLAARSTLPRKMARELENLHFKQQREGLTTREIERDQHLLHQYDRVMLIRAQAAVLLKERGHDIDVLRDGKHAVTPR